MFVILLMCSTHVNPTVWATSGDNRIHLWDVKTGECMSSLTVCEGNAPVDEVVLNAVPVRVGIGGTDKRVGNQ